MNNSQKHILKFEEVGIKDVSDVGGKNASLGEMIRTLKEKGVPVPSGFVVTASAYFHFLKETGLDKLIKETLRGLDAKNLKELHRCGETCRNAIMKTELPKDLTEEIVRGYRELEKRYGKNADVAVRSSATAEDLPGASFAGEQESYLGIRGAEEVLKAVRATMASLFTDRAISYRADRGFDHLKIALSAGVQKMVRSDKACSGVMFTLDTESGFPNIVLINGSWGLGEMIVKGEVTPDEFIVWKGGLKQKVAHPIIEKKLGVKFRKMIYHHGAAIQQTRIVPTTDAERDSFVLSDAEIGQLARWGTIIEDHYTEHYKKWTPMDMEWAKDGATGELFIVQARPETIQANRDFSKVKEYRMTGAVPAAPALAGAAVGSKIASGKSHIILDTKNIGEFKKGEVLITTMTDPDWEPVMKMASAIVTDKGGRTCFAGDTLLLTNRGFLKFRDVHARVQTGESFSVYAYDYQQKKTAWKKVLSAQKNKLPLIRVNVSQTGNMRNNYLDVTRDHKFYTYENRRLVKKPLDKILENKEAVSLPEKLPLHPCAEEKTDIKMAYLLGAFATDGSIYLRPGVRNFRSGAVIFTQKQTLEKQEFVATVNSYFADVFGKSLTPRDKTTVSELRGRTITGTATDFRCFSLPIALQFYYYFKVLPELALSFSKEAALHFLAGVIDGDGSFCNNRIQIYASKEYVQQAVVISCLRLGIVPQVTVNRNIWNIQILERMDDILAFVKKIKVSARPKLFGTKLFAARQILGDVIDAVNYKGRIKTYVNKNLFIDARKVRGYVLPLADPAVKKELETVLDASLRMQRIVLEKDLGENDVFNIEVEAQNELDHNYVVFTNRLSPLLVSNSHAAIVSRELGIPAVVGTEKATREIKTGDMITVDTTGSAGKIYRGALKFKVVEHDLKKIPHPKTKVMVNVAIPDSAFETSFLPNSGVGLAREEFIIASKMGLHPMALLAMGDKKQATKLAPAARAAIGKKMAGWRDPRAYYIDNLAFGIAKIGAAFYPDHVIVRFSDFKTNEYRTLLGGEEFEPREENPMIGWRGASRYYDPKFKPAFMLEVAALKMVRGEMGLDNVIPMVPFCRTVEEGMKVQEAMAEAGLVTNFMAHHRSANISLKHKFTFAAKGKKQKAKSTTPIYVMCEIPSNVLLADEFLDIFDGMSIGSNDLTQLTLGLDRDSGIVSHVSNENNPAVKKLIAEIIAKCRARKKYIGICGQAPSDYPDFATFLVEKGIESISLNPDTVASTTVAIAKKEAQLKRRMR